MRKGMLILRTFLFSPARHSVAAPFNWGQLSPVINREKRTDDIDIDIEPRPTKNHLRQCCVGTRVQAKHHFRRPGTAIGGGEPKPGN
jgi:hypothetical protein